VGSRKSTTTTNHSDGVLLGKRAAKDWEYIRCGKPIAWFLISGA
jgi:hypothetical protein